MAYVIPQYPDFNGLKLEARALLDARFKYLGPEISEFTFANLYLFRSVHGYAVSFLPDGNPVVSGADHGESFFMLPFGLPSDAVLADLFKKFSFMKCVSGGHAEALEKKGYAVTEDAADFDYLYSREELSSLAGRKFHRKKNLVNFFTWRYEHGEEPLTDVRIGDALEVLESWRSGAPGPGDYEAAKEGLLRCDELKLCGGVYYVEGAPAAYVLGEELNPETFVIHFEKGVPGIKGLLQYVTMHFSSLLPARYRYINREQDLGEEGLRRAKESWRPVGHVRKYRVKTF
ncbi:hypothetical protein BAC1_01380 [uncultured bacterium]|nr:hypothetical protein BAC1_01380 [uncultured bacterium]